MSRYCIAVTDITHLISLVPTGWLTVSRESPVCRNIFFSRRELLLLRSKFFLADNIARERERVWRETSSSCWKNCRKKLEMRIRILKIVVTQFRRFVWHTNWKWISIVFHSRGSLVARSCVGQDIILARNVAKITLWYILELYLT